MTAQTLQSLYQRQKLFYCLALGAAALGAAYVFLASSVIFHLAARQRSLEELSVRQSEVVALEAEYLTFSGQLTLDFAHGLGFRDAGSRIIFTEPLGPMVAGVALRPTTR